MRSLNGSIPMPKHYGSTTEPTRTKIVARHADVALPARVTTEDPLDGARRLRRRSPALHRGPAAPRTRPSPEAAPNTSRTWCIRLGMPACHESPAPGGFQT